MPNFRPLCFLTHNAKNNRVDVGPYTDDILSARNGENEESNRREILHVGSFVVVALKRYGTRTMLTTQHLDEKLVPINCPRN